MKSILIGHDGSASAKQAMQFGAQLAKAYGARVILLHVVRPTAIPGDLSGQLVADLTAHEVRQAQEQVNREADTLRAAGQSAEAVVLEGEAASSLAEYARATAGTLLILVGAHGKTAVQRAVLGSTTYRLMHLSPVPVLVWPAQATAPTALEGLRRILVPVDFSEASLRAARTASELCGRVGARLELLHAWTPPWFLAAELRLASSGLSILEYGEREANAGLAAFVRAAELGPALVRTRVIQEAAAPAILRIAAQESFDLVVMGTHGRGTIKRLLLGNTAHKTVAHAPCPVLAVPGAEDAVWQAGEMTA